MEIIDRFEDKSRSYFPSVNRRIEDSFSKRIYRVKLWTRKRFVHTDFLMKLGSVIFLFDEHLKKEN